MYRSLFSDEPVLKPEDVANKVPEISTILKDVITTINCFRWLRIKTRDKTCIIKAGFDQSSAVNIMSYVSIYALKRILIKAINGSDMFRENIDF